MQNVSFRTISRFSCTRKYLGKMEQGKREEVKDDTGEKKCMPLGVKKKRAGAVKLDQILPGPARRATQCIRKATVIRKIKELHALTGMQAILRMKSLAGAETVYKTPICDIGLNSRSRDVCCQTEASDETTPSVDFPSPKAVRKRDSGVDVNGEKKKKSVRRKIQCSICKVAYHRDDSIWIGCSKRGCKVFLHAKCAGIICEERTDLNRISYFCESHRL